MPGDEGEGDDRHGQRGGLLRRFKTILLADLVMSLDNVIAVAAAAKGNQAPPLLIIGLALSIPLIVFGSQLLLGLMGRFPIIITLGAALLGWVAGDMAVTDPAIDDLVHRRFGHIDYIVSAACGVSSSSSALLARRAEAHRGAR